MTPLLRRAFAEKRMILVPLLVALAVNVLAYVLVVRPLEQRSANAADRTLQAAANLGAAEKDIALARALVNGKTDADQELRAFYQKVLPQSITEARRMTYASLPALARKSGVRYETRSTAIDPEGQRDANSRLGHMTIRMVLEGEYRDIRQFIYELESAPEFVIIDSVTLAEVGPGEPQTLTIDLSTYYVKADGT